MALKTKNRNKKTASSSETPAQRTPFVDSEEIPASYNKNNLTLVARDPFWIYAHWEIISGSIDKIRENIGGEFEGSALTLRMYDITLKNFDGNNANSSFDIDINLSTNNWYISLWQDNVTYCGAIGIRTRSGAFHQIVRSNFVRTPSANSSWRRDMIWMDVPPAKTGVRRTRSPRSFVLVGRVPKRRPVKGKKWRERIHLTADDIRAYYYNLFPLLRVLRRKQLSSGTSVEKSKLGSRRITQKDLEMSVGDPGLLRSDKHYKKFRLGASGEFDRRGGASEQEKFGASERTAPPGRKFFFELGTELIVYGRTEPDAEVFWEGKKINLRPDGTFSLRMVLPDGHIPLGFKAVSKDKVEERTITTGVTRSKTMYSP